MRCLSQPSFSIYVYRKNIPKGPTWVVQYQLLAVKHFIPFICEACSIVKSLFKTSLRVILCNAKGRSSVPSYINSSLPSWWFRSTHLKNLLVKIRSFPQVGRGKKNNKYLKQPPPIVNSIHEASSRFAHKNRLRVGHSAILQKILWQVESRWHQWKSTMERWFAPRNDGLCGFAIHKVSNHKKGNVVFSDKNLGS